jgi:hypothetical protein
MDVFWRPPHDSEERRTISKSLICFDRARELDPNIEVPGLEIAQLKDLLDDNAAQIPREQGIGYRRRRWRRPLTGQWSIEVPGYFYDRLEDDDTTQVYWFGDKEVWASSWNFSPVRDAERADIEKHIRDDSLTVEHFGIVGCANIRKSKNGDHLVMSCEFQGRGTSAVVTLVLPDRSEIPWAEAMFRSVRLEAADSDG